MAKTFQELNLEISQKKIALHSTDSQVLEYVEGLITDEEFDKIKQTRASLRDEISKDEKKLPAAKKAWEAEMTKEIEEQEE